MGINSEEKNKVIFSIKERKRWKQASVWQLGMVETGANQSAPDKLKGSTAIQL